MKIIQILVLPFILASLMSLNVFSQEIKSARFEQRGDQIFIIYELNGDPDKEYSVENVVLKNKSNPEFKLEPETLEGAIGDGEFAKGSNTITWTVNNKEQDILGGFQSEEDFYFQFNVTEIKEGSSWLYYIGGGILAGGGAAAYIFLKGKEQSPPVQQNNFPVPPDRP